MRYWQSASGTETVLSVRSSKGADSGEGLFQTLVPVHFKPETRLPDLYNSSKAKRGFSNGHRNRSPYAKSIGTPLMFKTSSLASRFIEYLDHCERDRTGYRIWGSWMEGIVARIGHSAILDSAATCFLVGCEAHQLSDDETLRSTARKAYAKCLFELRQSILDPNRALKAETIAAVKLLAAFEVSLFQVMLNTFAHRDLIDIFRRQTKDKCMDSTCTRSYQNYGCGWPKSLQRRIRTRHVL
jgi:hypothetical protein